MSSPTRSNGQPVTRREFIAAGAAANLVVGAAIAAERSAARLASGVKVGEVTDHSAILWTRLTRQASRVGGPKINCKGKRDEMPKMADVAKMDLAKLEGACPGARGRIRVRYATREDLSDAKTSAWVEVGKATDFSNPFALDGLPANAVIHYAVETADSGPTGAVHGALTGSFRTAPRADQEAAVKFTVVTCQSYCDLDHDDGFHIYPAMAKLAPHFVAFTGDNVYYDDDPPHAVTPALANYHWQRMYSLPRHVALLRSVSSYWQKDDHDTCRNDCWPGKKYGRFTFAEGQRIFRQQTPMGRTIYRTFRWGKFLQIWLTDGRDFRSANREPDGPDKTIWGKKQKDWLFRTIKESTARWKVLVSPTPLVGPDRQNKNDNHANRGFRHEADEARAWFQKYVPGNFFVVCGDRHWQYHSVHPATGLHEFSVGPASDRHASGSPGEDKTYHRFHRVKGGFLTVSAAGASIVFEHRDVFGAVVYRFRATRRSQRLPLIDIRDRL